jgi:hypothetical protein
MPFFARLEQNRNKVKKNRTLVTYGTLSAIHRPHHASVALVRGEEAPKYLLAEFVLRESA